MTRTASAAAKRDQGFSFQLWLITVLALVLRLGAVLWIPTKPISDFWSYVHLAETLVRGDGYAWSAGNPTAIFAPGYPLLLAGVFMITGSSLAAVNAVNLVLSSATVFLAGLAARELMGRTVALVAAMIICLEPRGVLLACIAASEHLLILALFAFLWSLALSWRRERSVFLALIGGLALGVSALARPVVFLAWPLWTICAALAGKRRKNILVETAVLVATLYSLILPWGLRNFNAVGRFTTSTTTAGINLFMGNNDVSTGTWSNWEEQLRAIRPDAAGAPEGQVDAIAGAEGWRWIVANPVRAARLYLLKVRMYLWSEEPWQVGYWAIYATQVSPPTPPGNALDGDHLLKRHEHAVGSVLNVTFCLLLLLGLLGSARMLWSAWSRSGQVSRAAAVALVGLTLYFPLVTSVFIVVDRYRWPMEDLLALLSAFALVGGRAWHEKSSTMQSEAQTRRGSSSSVEGWDRGVVGACQVD